MNVDDLMSELQQYLDILNIKQISDLDGDAISRLSVKLASYNSTLGGYVAQAEREASLAELHYDLARERLYKQAREEKRTIADADNIKRMGAEKEQQKAIELKYQWRVMSLLRSDVSALIDTLRSRGAQMRNDRETS